MTRRRCLMVALLTFAPLAPLNADPPCSKTPIRTDLYGDPLPEGAIARLGTVRFRNSQLNAVTLSPDGKTVAAACYGGTIRLWEVATGKEVRRLEAHCYSGDPVAWSPDGKILASAGSGRRGNRIRLWDPASGKEIRRLELKERESVWILAWSPDSGTLAWVELYDGITIRFLEVATGREVRRLAGHQDRICAIAWSPDCKHLASGSKDKTIRLWDPATGNEVHRLTGHKESVEWVAWSPDGRTLASLELDWNVHLWDPMSEKERKSPADGEFPLWSPDGKTIAWFRRDGTLRMLDAGTGKELWTLPKMEKYSLAGWSSDGKVLIWANGCCIRLWDSASGKEIRPYTGHTDAAYTVAWSSDGKTLASGSSDRTIRLWDPATGKEVRRITGHEDSVASVVWSPDGTILASASKDHTIRLWEPGTGKEIRRLTGHAKDVGSVAWSPDGTMLVSTSDDKTIRLWEAANGKEIHRLASDVDFSRFVSWSPDGRTLAFSGDDNQDHPLVLFDTTIRKEVRRFAHRQFIKSISWSPDGKVLASVNRDKQVRLWEAATGKEIRQVTDPTIDRFSDGLGMIAWSPDGRSLVSVDRFDAIRLSTDGRSLVSMDGFEAIRLWEVATGKQVGRFLDPEGKILSVAWSPDSKTLATANGDSTILLWAVNTPSAESPIRLELAELQSCWADLAGDDAGKAHAAIRTLTRGATDSVLFLAKHLKPVAALPDPQRVSRLIADLDSNDFSIRQRASEELHALGEPAGPALRRARESNPTPERRKLLGHLLDGLDSWSGERLAALRATTVLENIGTADARKVLQGLAKGAPEAMLTQEAKASLGRLAKRSASVP